MWKVLALKVLKRSALVSGFFGEKFHSANIAHRKILPEGGTRYQVLHAIHLVITTPIATPYHKSIQKVSRRKSAWDLPARPFAVSQGSLSSFHWGIGTGEEQHFSCLSDFLVNLD